MEAGSSSPRNEVSVSNVKPYHKLRLGGSRSGVTGKFLKDTSTRHDPSILSLQHTRSADSQSVSSRSTDSSVNAEKVRIVGRGGAGARRRNYAIDDKRVGPPPALTIEMKPLKKPQVVLQDAPVVRNVGRGGLGSRPQPRKKSKVPAKIDTQITRKVSKQFSRTLSLDPNVRPQQQQSPEHSPVSTISTIHFAGETGLPTPDFFKVTKRKRQIISPMDISEIDEIESLDSNEIFDLQPLRATPSAVPWDDSPGTSQSNLSSRTKAKRRERGFSMLFSIFHNDGTRKPDSSSSSLPSMSVPSQITLTSIDTDPSYFFHGPGSPPSTPPCGQETDSTTGSSYSARLGSSLSSFQREPSPSSKEEVSQDGEIHEPSSPSHDHGRYPPTKRRELPTLYLSASEAEALEHSPPCSPFIPPTIPEEGSISTERESWSGEWNVGMVDVMRALRELR